MAKSVKEQLIKQLSLGQFVSGQAVGEELGISRAAVSKHIRGLQEMGLDVFCVTGKGYRFSHPLLLLDKTLITQGLATGTLPIPVEVHSVIDSTNSYLLRRIPHQVKQGQVCVAEYQDAGRGRRGRQWISPFGSHIYMSMYWCLEQGISAAMGLSVVAALAVSDAIKQLYNLNVELKWPNDIYANGKKLAGILIDLEGQALEASHCVIGIGLNINMPAKAAENIDQPWTDLQSNVSDKIDRNQLVSTLINCLVTRLEQHKESGIVTMVDDWLKQDVYINKPVRLITGEKETLGICRGINTQGALLLEVDGQVKPIYGGEVSMRGVL
ncbi:MAG: bifunctional biotin--[acetyl-CoA-carboxylase] ligase/biotin operon repressor BirA [Colwelliaceae bacterium]|jgi:BirA family biotin operon repressor/biotin-[acetyl-CoA-carboxylase] ligase|nr:bifunctional biotin--[acetyl-CoA-carboxylase] ligase/biotin operon repressor BirA [Colwelliaceae bacterium]